MKRNYRDRVEAGTVLAGLLEKYRGTDAIVLAVPRGGVPIGYVVATELGLQMDIILSKKIGHPSNKEYAIGAVSLTGSVINVHEDVPEVYVKNEIDKIRRKLAEMREVFSGGKVPLDVSGRTVIVVDDGVATGSTLLETISILKKEGTAKIVVAVPVASRQAFAKLSAHVDEIACPLVPDIFYGVGSFYDNFEQVSDNEVIHYIQKLRQ